MQGFQFERVCTIALCHTNSCTGLNCDNNYIMQLKYYKSGKNHTKDKTWNKCMQFYHIEECAD